MSLRPKNNPLSRARITILALFILISHNPTTCTKIVLSSSSNDSLSFLMPGALSTDLCPVGNRLSPLKHLNPVWFSDQTPPLPESHGDLIICLPPPASLYSASLPCFKSTLAYFSWCLNLSNYLKKNGFPQYTVTSRVQRSMSLTQCLVICAYVRHLVNICWMNQMNELFKAAAIWPSHPKFQTRKKITIQEDLSECFVSLSYYVRDQRIAFFPLQIENSFVFTAFLSLILKGAFIIDFNMTWLSLYSYPLIPCFSL